MPVASISTLILGAAMWQNGALAYKYSPQRHAIAFQGMLILSPRPVSVTKCVQVVKIARLNSARPGTFGSYLVYVWRSKGISMLSLGALGG